MKIQSGNRWNYVVPYYFAETKTTTEIRKQKSWSMYYPKQVHTEYGVGMERYRCSPETDRWTEPCTLSIKRKFHISWKRKFRRPKITMFLFPCLPPKDYHTFILSFLQKKNCFRILITSSFSCWKVIAKSNPNAATRTRMYPPLPKMLRHQQPLATDHMID
jgi:hypothetical protein